MLMHEKTCVIPIITAAADNTFCEIFLGFSGRKYDLNTWASTLFFCTYAYAQTPSYYPHVGISSGARYLNFDLSLNLRTYFVYGSSEGPDEPEPSLLHNLISIKSSCAGSFHVNVNIKSYGKTFLKQPLKNRQNKGL